MTLNYEHSAIVSAKDMSKVMRLDGRKNSFGTIKIKTTRLRDGKYWVVYHVG